jgi:hypothetical protein
MLEKAKVTASELADKAGPYVGKAAGMAAHGVTAAAGQLDKATKGKYSDKITAVTSKIEKTLDRDKAPAGGGVADPGGAAPAGGGAPQSAAGAPQPGTAAPHPGGEAAQAGGEAPPTAGGVGQPAPQASPAPDENGPQPG